MERRTFLALGTSVAIAGCNTTSNSSDAGGNLGKNSTENSPNEEPPSEFDRIVQIGSEDVYAKDYDLLNISYSERPQWFSNPFRYPSDPPDPESVEEWPNSWMADVQGQTGHHPLRTTRSLGRLSDWYRMTGDDAYLRKAELIRDELINEHTTNVGDSFYFNYGFDHQLKTDHVRTAPWFSGMTQGTGLSAFVSWYETTGDNSWLTDAERTYHSLTDIKENRSDPYVTYAESDYLWLAEYPEPNGSIKVLNGFVIGLWVHLNTGS
ncbi:D-glucuronyl C5-epimerase family protein [Halorubrum sp. DTA46]|uniref:D-glucuronyl C5-epimerase family protein n=1 Tax=Halorubrum sp. DTA46 TaxID=3402162 RepID=UPI003AAB26AF